MSSSLHVDNKGKDISILCEGGLNNLLTAEAKYPINFTKSNQRFLLYTIMGTTVSYLLILQSYINVKQKIQKLKKISIVFS